MNIRVTYLTLAIVTMLLGLASRADGIALPVFIATYAGDTLWAMLVFWLVRFLKPSMPVLYAAAAALSFAFMIEFLQLYHEPWIDNIRATTLGGLVLGFGFKFSDLVCYSVGVIVAAILNKPIVEKLP